MTFEEFILQNDKADLYKQWAALTPTGRKIVKIAFYEGQKIGLATADKIVKETFHP